MSLEPERASTLRKGKVRVYQPPQLVRVSLKTDEVLVTGCKMTGGAPNLGNNPACGIGVGCSADGS